MLRHLDLRGLTGSDLVKALPRPDPMGSGPVEAVRAILDEVRHGGDAAIRDLTQRFDHADLDDPRLGPDDLAAAARRLDPSLLDSLVVAHSNIAAYHQSQAPLDEAAAAVSGGVRELRRPVRRAGCYVPGGRAAYPSTVLMTVVPARVAGVAEVIVCVPPHPDGSIPDVVAAAAHVAGADEVWRIGGAQAVAAMAFGTDRLERVDVIVGPGNVYVAVAKQLVAGAVGVPSAFAGPSEVVVVADGSVPAELVAIDVVLQAEHGPGGLAWLITWDEAVASAVVSEIESIIATSARRDDITSTLASGGIVALVEDADAAMVVANEVAPEHLELLVDDPGALLDAVHSAGAVFCGPWSPASVGDYAAGPNHVLPTAGTARFAEALRVDDFVKHIHVVDLDPAALVRLGPHVMRLAEAEGLGAHSDSVRLRLDRLAAGPGGDGATA